jgi:tetratricopeptide (TPR) repeat protein
MLSYRTILVAVSVFSLLSIAGMRDVRTALLVAIVLINVFAWTWPLIERWSRRRNRLALEGERQLQIGNYSEAEKSLEAAAAEAIRRSASALKQAGILLRLAEARRKLGRLPEAEQTVRMAMPLVAGLKGPGRSQYGYCLEMLAAISEDQGNYPQAQSLLREALGVEQSLARPGDEILAKRSLKLALAHHNAGDHEAATPHFADALELHERAFGPDHPETAAMLAESGSALSREGNHAGAADRLERALRIKEKTVGADSPEVVPILYPLALCREQSGRLEDAAAQLERILALRRRQVGAGEAEQAAVFCHLSRVYLGLGRMARAEETAQSAILTLERTPGAELQSALETLSKIYERSGRGAEAAAARDRAESIHKSSSADLLDPLRSRQTLGRT